MVVLVLVLPLAVAGCSKAASKPATAEQTQVSQNDISSTNFDSALIGLDLLTAKSLDPGLLQQIMQNYVPPKDDFSQYITFTENQDGQSQSKPPGDYLNDIDPSKVQESGTAVINGETCSVFQYTNTDGTTIKMWLSVDLDFPVQITSTTTDGQTTTAEYTNIKVGSLPSDTFKVPANVKIRDLSNTSSPQNLSTQQ
jgi:outer membrane lipoprotein-sorting protein